MIVHAARVAAEGFSMMTASAERIEPPPARLETEPARLVVDGVTKYFQRTKPRWGKKVVVSEMLAIDSIGFDVFPGQVVSLLGPSGCGKTTLLRIVAGLAEADEGEIRIDGEISVGPNKKKALVFQHFGLLPWRTVIDNVAFPLELDGVPLPERRAVAERLVKLVGLAGFELHYPDRLSGGMQQRVGIARAMAREPLLLLMDEPFGALDAQTREVLQDELLGILKVVRNTVVFVTHSIQEAVLLSDKVVVFTPSPGRIKAIVEIPGWIRDGGPDARTSAEAKAIEHDLREMLRRERP